LPRNFEFTSLDIVEMIREFDAVEMNREFDVVVWGATGFTGKWVAKYLFEQYQGTNLKWAIAGRNTEKIQEVRSFIGDEDGRIPSILADSTQEESLRSMVASTKVIITTVGPYAYYGSLLVKVCAELGTHYVDLSGEAPWIRRMVDSYQGTAEKSGARIVNCCGFDSIPSDMGTFYIQQKAKQLHGEYLDEVRFVLKKMKGGASGGTIHSMFNVLKEAVEDKAVRQLLANPYSLNPDPKFKGPDRKDQTQPVYDSGNEVWTAPFVMAAINTRVVRRGHAVLGFPYGENFKYSETMVTQKGIKGRLQAASIAYGLMLFTGIGITNLGRKFLAKLLPSQGEGPEVNSDNPGYYIIDFYGKTSNGKRLVARVKGDSDPGYGSTSKMLAESAVCLALDEKDLEVAGGFWTPASAMGNQLLERLQKNAGLSFEITQK